MLHNLVIPVKTGIQREILGRFVWIPAYAGMTCRVMQQVYCKARQQHSNIQGFPIVPKRHLPVNSVGELQKGVGV